MSEWNSKRAQLLVKSSTHASTEITAVYKGAKTTAMRKRWKREKFLRERKTE